MSSQGLDKVQKKHLTQICKLYEIKAEDLTYVGGFENYIFSFQKENQDYFLRIGDGKHMTFKLVQAELDWVSYLVEKNVPAVKPINSVNNRVLEKINTDDGSFNVVAFEKAVGEHLDHRNPPNWSDEIIKEYGRIIGRMHALSKNYEAKEAKRYHFKPSMDIEWLLKGEDKEVIERITELFQEIENLPKNKDSYGLVHGDLHTSNFFVKDDKITAILDFDRTCYKWFISEIAVALYYPLYLTRLNQDRKPQEDFVKRFLPLFMNGYEKENKLESDWMKKLNIFIQVRDVILFMYLPKELEDMKKNHRPRILGEVPYVDVQKVSGY
ncbi:MAG: phosphotransferase enzyme family protein [Candidatus Heimdallarchaeaceae archaeon]|jgi:Ser/Thr protein kinase RdoA (MazF antagonist)